MEIGYNNRFRQVWRVFQVWWVWWVWDHLGRESHHSKNKRALITILYQPVTALTLETHILDTVEVHSLSFLQTTEVLTLYISLSLMLNVVFVLTGLKVESAVKSWKWTCAKRVFWTKYGWGWMLKCVESMTSRRTLKKQEERISTNHDCVFVPHRTAWAASE